MTNFKNANAFSSFSVNDIEEAEVLWRNIGT